MVEPQPSKLMTRVRFPSPAPCLHRWFEVEVVVQTASSCPFGSVAEHSLGKGEVPGPIPGMGTIVSGASA